MVVGSQALAIAASVQRASRDFRLLVASDAGARGVVPEDDGHSAGHLGFMAHPRAMAALAGPDNIRAERIVAVGCDENLFAAMQARHGQVQAITPAAFQAWLQATATLPDAQVLEQRSRWLQPLAQLQRSLLRVTVTGERMSYVEVVDTVVNNVENETAFVIDAGQVRRIAVARLQCRQPRSLFVADGMAPMGWSLGAAIGVHLARPSRPVVAMLGDGAMRMHGIELATAARYRIPVLYLLFDNGAYGSVLARMDGAQEADTALLPAVDWCAFASAFGVEAIKADDRQALRLALAGVDRLMAPRLVVVNVPAIDNDAYSEPTGIDWGLGNAAQSRLDT